MKAHLEELVSQSLMHLKRDDVIPEVPDVDLSLERTRNPEHGDYACNIAMTLAKVAKMSPRDLAELIIKKLPESRHVQGVEIAGPGFINFHLSRHCQLNVIKDILASGEHFGKASPQPEMQITVEFVSANPTGPLHVGHGRGAAYGASLSNILEAAGFTVQREYYINDNGRQMDILASSVWIRYLELCGERVRLPDAGYQGEYVYDIARIVRNEHGDKMRFNSFDVYDGLPKDESEGGDKEKYIDALNIRAREMMGDAGYESFFEAALETIIKDIRDDLSAFGVEFDLWFSEQDLEDSESINHAIARLDKGGHLFKKDGATWLRASELGDEKDRVVIRENGRGTYFASDIAYFLNKLERGFKKAIYVLGADHHGYIARLKAAAEGLGEDPEALEILLVQFAVLYRNGKKVQMSTRSGEFITLKQLREEVGTDAARFFYVMRSHEQHLDFDLDLAKSNTNENPVYYIQYAHARICSVFRTLSEQDMRHNTAIGTVALELLEEDHENQLLRALSRYPEVIESAARLRAPHMMAHYLQEVANAFHSYYNAHQFIVEDENLRNARLNLIKATRQVIKNGLDLLGVSAPEEM